MSRNVYNGYVAPSTREIAPDTVNPIGYYIEPLKIRNSHSCKLPGGGNFDTFCYTVVVCAQFEHDMKHRIQGGSKK